MNERPVERKTQMTGLRALFGFLLAPGAPALALYLVALLFVNDWEAELLPSILAPFAYLATLVFGVPGYFFIRRKGIASFGAYLFLGGLTGLVFSSLFFGIEALLSWPSYPEHAIALLKNSAGPVAVAAAYATVSSAIFWLVAIWEPTPETKPIRRRTKTKSERSG